MPHEHQLTICTETGPDLGLLTIAGELIAESRFDMERALREWHEGGTTRVIVSCQDLKYIDSAGLSTLLGALHRFRRAGGDLILTEMNPALSAIFEVASMQKYFKIFPTLQEARDHFDQLSAQRRKQRG